MVGQLVAILAILLVLALIALLLVVFRALSGMKSLAEAALIASRATSARDFIEAKELSADAAASRELMKNPQQGSGIINTSPPEPTYTTPDGTVLQVLKPYL